MPVFVLLNLGVAIPSPWLAEKVQQDKISAFFVFLKHYICTASRPNAQILTKKAQQDKRFLYLISSKICLVGFSSFFAYILQSGLQQEATKFT